LETSTTTERIRTALEGLSFEERTSSDGMPAIGVTREELKAILERLRDDAGFVTVTMVTGVDRYPEEPRFELVHQLMSLEAERIRVTTRLSEADPTAPTCTDLWPGAIYMERECYDMFGIEFEGHEGLRRLLMPEEYGYHPLRKDFPHAGIEPDRLYREWDRERRKNWDPSPAEAPRTGGGRS